MTTILGQRICPTCGRICQAVAGDRCPTDGAALLAPDVLERHPDDPLLGHVLDGKYLLLDLIGVGGFGAVYRAMQHPVGRQVAIKVIRPRAGTDIEGLRRRFFREARAMATLTSGHTVSLYDYGEDGELYMVLELVEGPTLSSVMRREGPLAAPRVARIALQILESLAEAHLRGIVHRDLKPGNVMLVTGPLGDEKAKVLDFGIAKMKGSAADDFSTREGLVLGTPRYMAPEQARGSAEPRSDLYALGIMMYEMLSGQRPYGGDTPYAMLAAAESTPTPELPDQLVPPALAAVVRKAMDKAPEGRFADAPDMSAALIAVLGPDSRPFAALAPTATLDGASSRRPVAAVAVALLALAALVGLWSIRDTGPGSVDGSAPVPPDAAFAAPLEGVPPDAAPRADMASTGMASTGMASTGMASTDMAPTDMASTDMASTDMASTDETPIDAAPVEVKRRPPRRRRARRPPPAPPTDPLKVFK